MTFAYQLSKDNLDLLKELVNIGVGNATTALSEMMGDEKVDMTVPEVTVVPLKDVSEYLGDPEEEVAAVFFTAGSSTIRLALLFILTKKQANLFIRKMVPEHCDEEIGWSALMELGNVMIGAYLNALAFMTDMTFLPSPPALAVDMAGAVMETVVAETNILDDYLILVKTNLAIESESMEGNVVILPEHGSLDSLLQLMGVC